MRCRTTRASSPARTVRRRKWSWRSSRCTTPARVRRVVVSTYQATSGAALAASAIWKTAPAPPRQARNK